jgi:cytochrome c
MTRGIFRTEAIDEETTMVKPMHAFILAAAALPLLAATASAAGDAQEGARDFRGCAACHSLEPNRNMTGPSLAGVWGRKAGSLASFERYSPALKASGVTWNEKTLDQWLKNPAAFIPGNRMTFPGVRNAAARADLITFLKAASSGHAPQAAQGGGRMGGGMMGGMAGQHPDLKKVGPPEQVTAITYCRDTYHVTTKNGETRDFWEPNLRFKTDSSALGPVDGTPALVPAGMMGDRADVIFAKPGEISGFVKPGC